GPLVVCGYSFGAAAALRAAARSPRVRRAILVAPPPALLAGDAFAAPRRALVVTGDADGFAPPAALEPLLAGAPGAALHVVAGADHFFGVGLAEIGRVAAGGLGGRGPGAGTGYGRARGPEVQRPALGAAADLASPAQRVGIVRAAESGYEGPELRAAAGRRAEGEPAAAALEEAARDREAPPASARGAAGRAARPGTEARTLV